MLRTRAILGFCVGAVGGWTLGSSLMHAGRSLEAPGDRVEDGATGEAPNVVELAPPAPGEAPEIVPLDPPAPEEASNVVQLAPPAPGEKAFKDARSRIDERVRELGGRGSKAA